MGPLVVALVCAAAQGSPDANVACVKLEHYAEPEDAKRDFPLGTYGIKIWRDGRVRMLGFRDGVKATYSALLDPIYAKIICDSVRYEPKGYGESPDLYPDYSNPANPPPTFVPLGSVSRDSILFVPGEGVKYDDDRAFIAHIYMSSRAPKLSDWKMVLPPFSGD